MGFGQGYIDKELIYKQIRYINVKRDKILRKEPQRKYVSLRFMCFKIEIKKSMKLFNNKF